MKIILKKTFITNLALLLFLNLLVKPFWIFGIDRQVQNVVGAESYGFYFALFNFSLLLNILLDFGITNFNNRNISQNTQLLNKHFSNLIMLRVFLGLAYFVISIAAAALWGFQCVITSYSIHYTKLYDAFVSAALACRPFGSTAFGSDATTGRLRSIATISSRPFLARRTRYAAGDSRRNNFV